MLPLLLAASLSLLAADGSPTPAELRIDRALDAIAARPDDPRAYDDLAFAFARRARETADADLYARGHAALRTSLALEPASLGARRVQAWLLLGQHRYEEALEVAAELNRAVPDDLMTYGMLVDAHVELGNYAAAEELCQWLLDLRPGNVTGLTRAAYLRELFGDPEGALDLMSQAYTATPPAEREDRAWILTHMAHLHRGVGRYDLAAQLLERALETFPGYHYALANLARVRLAQGAPEVAVGLLRRRHEAAPHPENLFELAAALEAAGEVEEARELFARFEEEALAESAGPDNANRELVVYLVDHAEGRAADALRIATLERERRRDVLTRDAFAWALSATGEHDRARAEIEAALEVGIRDARMLLHAGAIAARQGDAAAARRWLAACRTLEPGSPEGTRAAELLERLDSPAQAPGDA